MRRSRLQSVTLRLCRGVHVNLVFCVCACVGAAAHQPHLTGAALILFPFSFYLRVLCFCRTDLRLKLLYTLAGFTRGLQPVTDTLGTTPGARNCAFMLMR
jgi:hypothetical protein